MVAASAAIYNDSILFYSFLLNASTLLLFLISDKSGNEMLVTQMGIYRFVSKKKKKTKSDNKVAGWFKLDNDVCFKMVFIMMSVLTFGNTWLWMGMGPHHIHWTLKKIWLTMWTIGLFNKKIYWMHGILPLI